MKKLTPTSRFKKDYKNYGSEIEKELRQVFQLLASEETLPQKYKDHKLTGNYNGHRECHIKPDVLLIYLVRESEIRLVRLGSHSELFK